MTSAQSDLIQCLDQMVALAQRRAAESPTALRQEHYEKIAGIAAEHRRWLLENDFPHMGTGAGLGFGKGLGEWGFPENGDHEMSRLGYRADDLHRTGEAR